MFQQAPRVHVSRVGSGAAERSGEAERLSGAVMAAIVDHQIHHTTKVVPVIFL
jgi:hypothetical protein